MCVEVLVRAFLFVHVLVLTCLRLGCRLTLCDYVCAGLYECVCL